MSADLKHTLSRALSEFGDTITSDRERAIWHDRVLSENPKSLQELGEIFGVSRERIRQVEVKLKQRVETYLKDRFGLEEIELALTDL